PRGPGGLRPHQRSHGPPGGQCREPVCQVAPVADPPARELCDLAYGGGSGRDAQRPTHVLVEVPVQPTPPKSGTGATGAATPTKASSATESALAFVDELDATVGNLKRELRSYGDADTVGRDAQQLREYFQRIHQCELQVAQAMGIDWTPGSS